MVWWITIAILLEATALELSNDEVAVIEKNCRPIFQWHFVSGPRVCRNDFVMGTFSSTSSCQIRIRTICCFCVDSQAWASIDDDGDTEITPRHPRRYAKTLGGRAEKQMKVLMRVPFETFGKLCLSEPDCEVFPEWGEWLDVCDLAESERLVPAASLR